MANSRLLILGGGFGGLDVARAVGRSRAARDHWDTLLIDKENFFQFNPLLPAVAVGSVETRHIVYPFRDMARHKRFRFYKNKVIHIDLENRRVLLHNNLVEHYDTLVIALGSITDYYGIPGAAEHTRPFKTIVDAMTLRARVVELFEMAEQAETEEQRRRLLSFAIVGGGVTGIEVAAELLDMARNTLLPKYPALRQADLSVTVIDGGDRIVATARPDHSAYVQRFLERRGVVIRLHEQVTRVEEKRLHLNDGTVLDAFTILWTAGVRPPDLIGALPLQHVHDGRVRVDRRLRALDPEGRPLEDVYVIGDGAAAEMSGGRYQPRLAQTAMQMGAYVGKQLARRAEGRSIAEFDFHDLGYIISLGQHSSVVNFLGLPISGRLGWLIWAGNYLIKMAGFRKQLEVAIDHVTHLVFEHDTSQIMNRRSVLSDEELNLSLGAPPPAPRKDGVGPPTAGDGAPPATAPERSVAGRGV